MNRKDIKNIWKSKSGFPIVSVGFLNHRWSNADGKFYEENI